MVRARGKESLGRQAVKERKDESRGVRVKIEGMMESE